MADNNRAAEQIVSEAFSWGVKSNEREPREIQEVCRDAYMHTLGSIYRSLSYINDMRNAINNEAFLDNEMDKVPLMPLEAVLGITYLKRDGAALKPGAPAEDCIKAAVYSAYIMCCGEIDGLYEKRIRDDGIKAIEAIV